MKENLLKYLKCLSCGSNNFELKVDAENEIEIREGNIICKSCKQIYKITNGIPDFLFNPSKEVLAEIKGSEKQFQEFVELPDDLTEDSIKKMPYIKSEIDPGHYESVAVNFDSMIKKMNLFKEAFILDVGAYNCWTTNIFTQSGCSAIAVDISTQKHSGLESSDFFITKETYFDRVKADMNNLPFEKDVFDYVFFNNVLHHSSQINKVINHTYSLLKKGGKLVLVGEPSYGIFSKKGEFGKEEREKYNINENIYPFLLYKKFMKKSGFKNIKFYFPPAIDMKLTTGKYGWKRVHEDLFEFINFFWRRKWLRRVLRKVLLMPAALIYNFQVHCIAEK